eukprot:3565097-Prymnesium_polylepis.1
MPAAKGDVSPSSASVSVVARGGGVANGLECSAWNAEPTESRRTDRCVVAVLTGIETARSARPCAVELCASPSRKKLIGAEA